MALGSALQVEPQKQVQHRCMKIVVCAPKGGVGKTTIIMGLLVCARAAGLRAVGINMDEQQTLTTWGEYRRRQIEKPPHDFVDVPILTRDLDDYRRVIQFDLVDQDVAFFDTPPGHSHYRSAIASLCEVADLIIIPTGTSAVDLTEIIPFGQRYAGRKGVFCLNAVNRRTASFRQAQYRLLKGGRLCPVEIPRLEGIHTHFEHGLTAIDVRQSGASEFEAVWNFVQSELAL